MQDQRFSNDDFPNQRDPKGDSSRPRMLGNRCKRLADRATLLTTEGIWPALCVVSLRGANNAPMEGPVMAVQ